MVPIALPYPAGSGQRVTARSMAADAAAGARSELAAAVCVDRFKAGGDASAQLAALKGQGLITEEEFEAKKKQILGI